MDEHRHRMVISAVGHVQICVDFHNPEGQQQEGSAWIQCLSCGREMATNVERRLFECPECSYELTPAELNDLCERYTQAVEKTFGYVRPPQKKEKFWHSIPLFGRRKRTQKTLLPSSEEPLSEVASESPH